jgi:Holliday junction resolvase-like predicted endonuclease
MNTKQQNTPLPDVATVAPELTMAGNWDSVAVSDLIRSKSNHGETPAFLFLGRRESRMLKRHLAAAFGEESVVTLHGTYYMGLEVVSIDCDSFVYAGGRKTSRTLQDPIARRPQWRDADTESLWQFRI